MPYKMRNKRSLLLVLWSMLSTPLAYTPGMVSDNLALLPKVTSYKNLHCPVPVPDSVVCHSNHLGAEMTHSQRPHFSVLILTHTLWVNSLIPVKLNSNFKRPIGSSRCSWNSCMHSRLSSSTWSFALPWYVLLCLPSDVLSSHQQMYIFSMLLHLLHANSSYKLNLHTCMQWKKRSNPFSSLSPLHPKMDFAEAVCIWMNKGFCRIIVFFT